MQNSGEREVVKEDLETILKLSLDGVMEIEIDDFLDESVYNNLTGGYHD